MLKKSEKNPVTKLSANWNNSSKAEGFYWNLNNVSGNRNRNISGQLVNAQNTPLSSGGVFIFLKHTHNTLTTVPLGKTLKQQDCISRLYPFVQVENSVLVHTEKRTDHMKRYGNLFEKICSMENLELAFKNAKKGKGWYREVKQIEKRPYYYLAGLQWMMKNHLYKTSEYTSFMKKDGKKEREIYKLLFFPDRIAQWAVLQVIEPQLLAYFTDDTYSAIPNKGIHAAYRKLRKAVDEHPEEMTYCLKIDCKKFYPSIDHETLKQKFRRKYKDPELLNLIDEIIDSISTCPATDENIEFYRSVGNEIKIVKINGKDFIDGVGIPIGNYFSQYDGNFFLSGFDHWIKEVKRVKHYYRYMDDICIFARTKEELHQLLAEINEYFIQNLKLRIKGNYQIFPSFIRGIDFVGYRIFLNSTLLRKSTCQEMKRKMTNIRKKVENGQEMNYSEWCSINSYKGWLKHCDSSHLSDKYIVPIQQYADDYYTNHIKAKKKKKGGKKHERVRKSTQYKAA